jgi:DNA-binding CsgD family transcriptional regulator
LQPAWDVDSVVLAFQGAALDAERLPAAIDTLTRTVGAFGTILLSVEGIPAPLHFDPSLGDAVTSYVRDGWINRDVRYRGLPQMRRNGVATELDFVSPETIASHPYWQEWLAPHGLKWFAGLKVGFGDTMWCLSIQRTAEQGPFTSEEMGLLAQLSPHVSAAGALANALLFTRIDAALAAFEVSSTAVVLINGFGAAVGVNARAEALLGDDLQIANGRIVSFDSNATTHLNQAIVDLLWRDAVADVRPIVRLPRRQGSAIIGYLSRPAPDVAAALGACRCILTLIDPNDVTQPVARDLELVFGLTRAEAQMAALLGSGQTVEAAAQARGIRYDTARNHLKAIFAKLGIHRQAELAVMVTALTAKLGK